VSIKTRRNHATTESAPTLTRRPPARTTRVDVPFRLVDHRGLTLADIGAGVAVLAWVARRGIPTAEELAERYGITPGQASRHLDHLVAAGLLGGAA
jgi:predicted ArsR family transcriptional regulator